MMPVSWSAIFVELGNHLWQSTVFAAAVWLLVLMLRKNQARARYRLWLAASVKFLIPFSALTAVGRRWSETGAAESELAGVIQSVGRPFVSAVHGAVPAESAASSIFPEVLVSLWVCGTAAVVAGWLWRRRRVRSFLATAEPMVSGREFETLERVRLARGQLKQIRLARTDASIEPGVVGALRPVLLVPRGLSERLTDDRLEAVFAHEMSHVLRRDNLLWSIHVLVEALFWFHPLVWWLGSRLLDERERVCDEAALEKGSDPSVLAEGILAVSAFCLRASPAGTSGMTGANNLNKRIEEIMKYRMKSGLNPATKAFIAILGLSALAVPVWIGVVEGNPPTAEVLANAMAEEILQSIPGAVPQRTVPPRPVIRAQPQTPQQRDSVLAAWASEEVAYIISSEEGAAFNRLRSDEERAMFIDQFWMRRDPTPNTAENEFRDDYYRRIALANLQFTLSTLAGWRTDRGQILIRHGEPEQVVSAKEGTYQSPTGGGAVTRAFPFEIRRYPSIEGIGNNVEFEFLDSARNGNYRLEIDPQESKKAIK